MASINSAARYTSTSMSPSIVVVVVVLWSKTRIISHSLESAGLNAPSKEIAQFSSKFTKLKNAAIIEPLLK